ncbi:MAG TPA: Uma2 family endonuclease [Nocardioides sp.]|uniref:Uma2 family endonuclease n=1 Tax=uncultured Nocardioides sp. TaxID=198441 RepID=UPI00262AD7B3|nr:Uma2 family endonuclease [uncultured Nocardioides sp.]HRD62761.1 Uma2 family endonuclease [Nocardioides sp.]HRI97681.1 Uma2 family endonuclease [Nocardioides sp.]HRK47125.1 Uma2 family endonuclease [Nocardioides sp.]
MTAVWEPWGRAMTLDELDALPDDGRRHELINGTLLVTPAPSWEHQSVSGELFFLLRKAVPPGLRVAYAPVDVRIDDDTNLQPDLLVTEAVHAKGKNLQVPPLLAVEVLSPSTQLVDRNLKKAVFEALGSSSFWIVDPLGPSITAWELTDGRYVEAGHAEGDEALVLERPFPVRIVPQELVP